MLDPMIVDKRGLNGSGHLGGASVEADQAYYRRRSEQERSAAAAALDAKSRQAHLELAAAYDQRVATVEAASAHLVSA